MTSIAGKTVILTGASRGVGISIAHRLAKQGATIVGIARSQTGLDQVCREIEAQGGKAIGISFDLTNVKALSELVEKIEHLTGSIDILINNAGIEVYQTFQNYSLAEIQEILSLNLVSAMELSRLVLPRLLAQGEGHIVNIASLAGKTGHPYDSVYAASKAGLLMWSDSLRQELAGTGVRISTICPGYISDQGMLADTKIPAPRFAGTSKPGAVAIALVKAIEQNQAEAIVNQNFAFETLTRIVLAIAQFFPRFRDLVNQLLGVTQLNQLRTKKKFIHDRVRGQFQ